MGIDYIPVAGLDDNVVAGQRLEVCGLAGVESPGMLDKYGEVPGEVDGIPFRPAVLRLDYDPGRRREDRLTPAIAILQPDAEDKVMERAGPIETPVSRARINADDIVSISLTKQVGSVAWDFLAGGVGSDPFTPQREIYDDRSDHLSLAGGQDFGLLLALDFASACCKFSATR
jgi:hypothetical protein